MKFNYIIILFVFVLTSCIKEKEKAGLVLKKSTQKLSFPIDESTKTKIFTLSTYTEEATGKEYLTFQNQTRNEILFYDIATQNPAFKIMPEVEGPDGIGFLRGYRIKNLDSIFVAVQGKNEVCLINKQAELKDRFRYDETEDGKILLYNAFTTFRYRPPVFINEKMYIITTCDRWAEKNPVSATIDLENKHVQALYGFEYPSFPKTENKAKKSGKESDFSRCFDGTHFIYSFYFDEDIYICNIDHTEITKVNAKSRFINQIGYTDDFGNLTFKQIAENPNYGNLIYDPYRKLYYRVAYPKVEIENDVNMLDVIEYGRKRFSIIILDENFNLIGETLFPDYTYNSWLMFVREDGLYISSSHCMNPEFSDDTLVFQKFEV